MLNALPLMNGKALAAHALQHVLDGSGSPMETKVALMLTLPAQVGGFGLPTPALNAQVSLAAEAIAGFGREKLRPDLWWDRFNLALEYDSSLSHADSSALGRDVRRRRAYTLSGITELPISTGDVASYDAFLHVVDELRIYMGLRKRRKTGAAEARSRRLFRKLFFSAHEFW